MGGWTALNKYLYKTTTVLSICRCGNLTYQAEQPECKSHSLGYTMALAKYLAKAYKSPKETQGQLYRERLIQWRAEQATTRLEYPTRLDRARALGYKAKQGIFMVRQRVVRGGKFNEKPAGGRRSKKFGRSHIVHLNYQAIAQMRAATSYPNCEVLNSYWVGKDGTYAWYEIIMVDPQHPVVRSDESLRFLANARGRAFRGLTSANKKSRGMRRHGVGAEKVRPSLRANQGRLH
jgi:large subunit ribosomal protein L15e